MKYLKEFKIFESIDIIRDLEDIFSELSDSVYDVIIKENYQKDINISIAIHEGDTELKSFRFSEIEDTIKRSIDYLEDYKFDFLAFGEDTNLIKKDLEDLTENLILFQIWFSKKENDLLNSEPDIYLHESSDYFKAQLSEKLSEVRDVFIDFEDMDIISYSVTTTGYEQTGHMEFNPKVGNFEMFLDRVVSVVKLGLTPDENLGGPGLTQKYNLIGSRNRYTLSDKDICIICNLKIPGVSSGWGSTVLDNKSIKIFEDIVVANSRLIDMGYDIKLDLNASHNDYKPVKFFIYFNI